MDDSKTKVCSVRYAPATWQKIQEKAHQLGIPASKLVELVTRSFLGEPVADKYRVVCEAFQGP